MSDVYYLKGVLTKVCYTHEYFVYGHGLWFHLQCETTEKVQKPSNNMITFISVGN